MTNQKKIIVKLAIYKKSIIAMTKDIKHASDASGMELSRHQIADKMSEILGVTITKTMLDNWTGKRHSGHYFPIIYLSAFVQATGQRRLFRLLMGECSPSLTFTMEIDQITQRISRLENERARLWSFNKEIFGVGINE